MEGVDNQTKQLMKYACQAYETPEMSTLKLATWLSWKNLF